MNGQTFLRIVNEAFAPFLKQLGFVMDEPSITGKYYRASFDGSAHAVWVSYEPGDEALFITVFSQKDGKLSNIDDRSQTPRLADLNCRYMATITSAERAANERAFESIAVDDGEECLLLKAAKELRLVLPKFLSS